MPLALNAKWVTKKIFPGLERILTVRPWSDQSQEQEHTQELDAGVGGGLIVMVLDFGLRTLVVGASIKHDSS